MSATSNHRAAAQRYIDACRGRIPAFVARHFAFRGTLELHRAALGGDLWRAPVNTLLAVPAFLVRVLACLLRCARLKTPAGWLERMPLGVTTAVDRRIEEHILAELLALPIAVRATLTERSPLSRLLRQYVRTRGAASELGVNAVLLCIGALVFGRLTPGSLSTATVMGQELSERSAIDAFPLGRWAGEVYYAFFPVSWSGTDIAIAIVATLGTVAMLSTFVGILADPLQRACGIHRRRLNRFIDALERRMVGAHADFKAKDAYFARLVDLVDAARAAGSLLP